MIRILCLEDSGTPQILGLDEIHSGTEFDDFVFLQTQLRLFVHAALSAVKRCEVDRDRLFLDDRRKPE